MHRIIISCIWKDINKRISSKKITKYIFVRDQERQQANSWDQFRQRYKIVGIAVMYRFYAEGVERAREREYAEELGNEMETTPRHTYNGQKLFS